jgi:DNA-directed RNA polymerase subunit RPC12/RpoP
MLLPFPHSWPVRCAKCGHTGTVTAATADLAAKPLRCGSCGHRQPFAPEVIARARPAC